MQAINLSIILPVRNVEQEISGILRSVVRQTNGIEAEFILVDMGSEDGTPLECVQLIKNEKLHGFVIQNGDGDVAAALNTGIQKASGTYVSFIFARRLYMDFLKGYLETAERTDADFVFGSFSEEDVRLAERRSLSKAVQQQSGVQYMKEVIRGNLQIDLSAVLLKRSFLRECGLHFTEGCRYGYAQEFLYRCLLNAQNIVQSPTLLKRDTVFELKRGKEKPVGKEIFQAVEAIQRVELLLQTSFKQETELQALFSQELLPRTVMNSVDVMLREGSGYNAVRGVLRVLGYDSLLKTGRRTEQNRKRRIRVWNLIPAMYQAQWEGCVHWYYTAIS